MFTWKALLIKITVAAFTFFAAFVTLLIFPEPLFSYSLAAHHLILYSDRPFSRVAAEHVLEIAAGKLAKSPLYKSSEDHSIFVCNARWRQVLFFNKDYGAGGVSPNPISPNVFCEMRILTATK
jgi:hypothetical protein